MNAPWICERCDRPIVSGGLIRVCDVHEGLPWGYPREPTPDYPDIPRGVLVRCSDLPEAPPERIAILAMHDTCDSGREGYDFDIGRAQTLDEWVSWVLHLSEKGWMGRRDLVHMLEYWYTNRHLGRPDS